jgi:hypothetical protein
LCAVEVVFDGFRFLSGKPNSNVYSNRNINYGILMQPDRNFQENSRGVS